MRRVVAVVPAQTSPPPPDPSEDKGDSVLFFSVILHSVAHYSCCVFFPHVEPTSVSLGHTPRKSFKQIRGDLGQRQFWQRKCWNGTVRKSRWWEKSLNASFPFPVFRQWIRTFSPWIQTFQLLIFLRLRGDVAQVLQILLTFEHHSKSCLVKFNNALIAWWGIRIWRKRAYHRFSLISSEFFGGFF